MFTADLNNGKIGEKLACQLLSHYGDFKIIDGYHPPYDLKGPFTVEVKTDLISQVTNNIGIEYQWRTGKPSGISTTKADKYFIICYDKSWSQVQDGLRKNGFWIGILIDTSTLKELIKAHGRYKRVYGGDNNLSCMILIPIKHLYEVSQEIIPIKSYN